MSSPYDESLLASAPKATKAQLQDGYNADLLVEKASSAPGSAVNIIDPEIADRRATAVQREEAVLPPTMKKSPFYHTQKGIIIIVVLVIIIIAAVVGGAVGGTVGKRSKHSDQNPLSSFNITFSTTTSHDISQGASATGEQGSGPGPTSAPPGSG